MNRPQCPRGATEAGCLIRSLRMRCGRKWQRRRRELFGVWQLWQVRVGAKQDRLGFPHDPTRLAAGLNLNPVAALVAGDNRDHRATAQAAYDRRENGWLAVHDDGPDV